MLDKIVYLFPLFLFISCSTTEINELQSNYVKMPYHKFPQKNRVAFIYTKLELEIDGVMSKSSNNTKNLWLESLSPEILKSRMSFKDVRWKPSKLNMLLNPKENEADYLLNYNVNEKVSEDESGFSKFLRFISFGFYKQKIKKNIRFELVVTNLKTFESVTVKRDKLLAYEFSAPMNIIPFDLSNHPFTVKDQNNYYLNELVSETREVFGE